MFYYTTSDPNELYHYGVKGMRWGKRKVRKWATSKHQPSSARSSFLTGMYAATGSERIGKALDRSNDRDAENWKRAKKEYKRTQNANYTDAQRKRDRALYGERGEQRINDKMNKGHGVQGARHYEVKRRDQKEKAKRAAKRGAKVAVSVVSTIGSLYIYDQVYNSGSGTKAVKAGVKAAGRAVVTAYMKARGGTDIRWYD